MGKDIDDIEAILDACVGRDRSFNNVFSEDYFEREDQRAFGLMVKHVLEDFTECAPHRLLSGEPCHTTEMRNVVRRLQDNLRQTLVMCWRGRHEETPPDWVCSDCGGSGFGFHACQANLAFGDDQDDA
jgi:hypothetical protein